MSDVDAAGAQFLCYCLRYLFDRRKRIKGVGCVSATGLWLNSIDSLSPN